MKDMEIIGVAIIGLFVVVAAAFALMGSLGASGEATGVQQPSAQGIIAQMVDGKQYVKLGMDDLNYAPNEIRVKVGVPVRMEFDMSEVRGCFAVVRIPRANVLERLTAADNIIEFTPQQAGVYSFSCSMGMAGGQIIAEL